MIDLSFLSCWLFLVLSSGIFYNSYTILDNVLLKYYLKYSSYDNDRKEYILTNMLKSIFLFFMSIAFVGNIVSGTINLYDTSNWSANIIFWKNLVAVYTSTDLVGLIRNKKMATTTIIHHYCVIIGFLVISVKQFKEEGVYKAIFIYGCFSSLAFLVNFYLGYRFLDSKDSVFSTTIKSLSHKSYLFVIICNILWQLYYIGTVLIYKSSIFMISILLSLVSLWLRDDLILLKFLSN
jgi:hypothetical protein